MTRLTLLPEHRLDADRIALMETIVGGKRGDGRSLGGFLTPEGAMRGPFNAMLHRPDLGGLVARLGEALRFEGRLAGRLREIAILVVAADWRARYEWFAHARIARAEGVDDAVIDAIAAGGDPALEDPAAAAVHAFARELVHDRRVTEATYERAAHVLGEPVVVELVMLLGYYGLVSGILNAFEVAIPDGETTPFDDA